jgi:flavin reductase (DIM6/NTAB) family NADH-FMN oxidoreductase RutF
MRLLAGGVTIVATAWEGERSGLTATAVCSLALNPPRVLASVNMQGRTYEMLAKSRIMSVNMLAQDHAVLAERFARKRAHESEDRFVQSGWCERVTGAPVLADALAALDCRITEIVSIDSHAILIGTVEDVLFGPKRPPLINFEGGFTTVLDTIPEKTT